MKRNIYRILTSFVLLFTVFSFGCAAAPELGSKADMSGYEGLTDKTDHVFIVSDAKDFLERMDNKETFIAYFGFDKCPWCNSMISILNDLGKEYGQEILYINTRPTKKVTANNQIDNYEQLFNRIGEYWDINPETGENYMYVPFVIFVKEGNVVSSHMGTIEDHIPDLSNMSEEQQNKLTNIYREGFKTAIESQ